MLILLLFFRSANQLLDERVLGFGLLKLFIDELCSEADLLVAEVVEHIRLVPPKSVLEAVTLLEHSLLDFDALLSHQLLPLLRDGLSLLGFVAPMG